MIKSFDKAYFLSHRGCYEIEKMKKLVNSNSHTTIEDFLNWPIPLKDKFFFVNRYTDLTPNQKQNLSLMCAKISLEIYENKYPNDMKLRNCIIATEQSIKGKIHERTLSILRNYAYNAAATAKADGNINAAYAAKTIAFASASVNVNINNYNIATEILNDTHTENLFNGLKKFCNIQI